MNLERLPEYVTVAVVTFIGMVVAVAAGSLIGSGRISWVILGLAACAVIMFVFTMRQNIWLLIPIGWAFQGQLPSLPLPFAVRDLVVMMVAGSYIAFVALKHVRQKSPIAALDLLLVANLVYLASAFIRHPVGVAALGSDRVAGRPYFTIFIAWLAYLVLRKVTPTRRQLHAMVVLSVLGSFIVGVINVVVYFVPSLAPLISRFYTGISMAAYEQQAIQTYAGDRERLNELSGIGTMGAQFVCSYNRPLTLFNPFLFGRSSIFLLSILAVLFSGHRSALLSVMLFFLLATYYRHGLGQCLNLGVVGSAALGLVVLSQGRLVQFPFAVQRTLSFIPARWDPVAVADARHSTEWRLEMWKIVLNEPGYIHDKWFGDGFGVSRYDLEVVNSVDAAKRYGIDLDPSGQENMMRMGNYHSGPISAIKYFGIVGMTLFYVFIIALAVFAHRVVLRAKGTELLPVALFFAIPTIYFPATYTLVFGTLDSGLGISIFSLGMLQLLDRAMAKGEAHPQLTADSTAKDSAFVANKNSGRRASRGQLVEIVPRYSGIKRRRSDVGAP